MLLSMSRLRTPAQAQCRFPFSDVATVVMGANVNHFCGQVAWEAGTITANAYKSGGTTPLATMTRKTADKASALQVSIKDGVGAKGLTAGCRDVALVQVFAVDANGDTDPTSSANVTFTFTGPIEYVLSQFCCMLHTLERFGCSYRLLLLSSAFQKVRFRGLAAALYHASISQPCLNV